MTEQNNAHTLERLFDKVDTIIASINCTNNSVSILSTKIDEFSHRLRKLEEKEDKHSDKQNELQLVAAKLETITSNGLVTIEDLEKRMTVAEKAIQVIKTNWGWVVAIVSAVGGAVGWVIEKCVSMFGG